MDKAIGVKYISDFPAPFIVSKGKKHLAKTIAEYALQCGIPIVDEPELAESLFDFEIGEIITEDFYDIVAEIFVFLRNLNNGKVLRR
jgi:type III secretion system FlhB-like substrate exporter